MWLIMDAKSRNKWSGKGNWGWVTPTELFNNTNTSKEEENTEARIVVL
jgi:hypothetical protein